VSRPEAVDLIALRARLAHISTIGEGLEGSLYLQTLACCYLASDNDTAEETLALENIYQEQAGVEEVDANGLLMALLLVRVAS
jgi:hypothetical protein